MGSGPSYGVDNGDGTYTYTAYDPTLKGESSNFFSTSSDEASSVQGTVEQKASSASSAEAKKQTNNAAKKSGAGMAGSILHAKGGVADTASGALEGNSKKAKTLG